jgi:hypothetical protein
MFFDSALLSLMTVSLSVGTITKHVTQCTCRFLKGNAVFAPINRRFFRIPFKMHIGYFY